MRRSNEHVHGSRRLRRALGLALSGAALVGLVYFEGLSARAEMGEEASLVEAAEDLEDLEAEADAVDEVDEVDEVEAEVATADDHARDGEDLAAARENAKVLAAKPEAGPLAMATVAIADGAAAKPVEPPAPALVVVPDIEGMSVRKAKKALKAVGLKLSVRDEYNWSLPRDMWGQYKVRKQKLAAGTEVAPGSTVKVKARMLAKYAMGY